MTTTPTSRAMRLRRTGMIWMATWCLAWAMFVALQDPGGWAWAAAVAAYAVPLAALILVCWRWPHLAEPALWVATGIALVGQLSGQRLGHWHTPAGALTSVALVVAVVGASALGHTRTRHAGAMLLVVGLGAVAVGLQTVYTGPVVVGAVLFLMSSLEQRSPSAATGAA